MKYKPAFERDYQFYLNNKSKFKFAGCVIPEVSYDAEGADAKEAFWTFDSKGKLISCREPELFRELLTCKKSINLHLVMWAQGYTDCSIPFEELLKEFVEPPEWVGEALKNQILKWAP